MIKIEIIYEDEFLIVLNKPAGVLVHPTPAEEKDTLVDFLKNHIQPHLRGGVMGLRWPDPTRPGIVHRLDKDTSGLIILAKTPEVLDDLQEQFKERKVQKTYTALVVGELSESEGKIEAAIVRGKSGIQEVRTLNISLNNETLRPAVTYYKVISKYKYQNSVLTLINAMPKTGRMHQIRTHLKYIGNPIIGDPLYNTKQSRNISKELGLERQFLHSTKLEFTHPCNNKPMVFETNLPKDLQNVLDKLKRI